MIRDVREWRDGKVILIDEESHYYYFDYDLLEEEELLTLDDLYSDEFTKVEEMTLEQVCKELGREIKIVKK